MIGVAGVGKVIYMIYSHSRLETFRNCPLSFKLRYIDKIRTSRESIEAFMGSRVHEALEKLYRDLQVAKMNSEDQLVEYYRISWEKNWHPGVFIVKKELSPDNYLAAGETCIRNYYRKHHPFDRGSTIWLERQVNIPLDQEGRYRLIGVVDRLVDQGEGRYEIHDYKTSRFLPDQQELDRDRQLALYQLAVESSFEDVEEVRLVWHFLTFDKIMESRRTPEELERVKEETIELIETIEGSGEFEPRESELCSWCLFQDICPLRKHLFVVEALPLELFRKEEGVRLADRYVELRDKRNEIEAELKNLKEEISRYCEENQVERLRGTSSILTVKQVESLSFPLADSRERSALEELLKELGHWEEVSTLNTRELGKAILERRWIEEDLQRLEPYVTKREDLRISVRKAESIDE